MLSVDASWCNTAPYKPHSHTQATLPLPYVHISISTSRSTLGRTVVKPQTAQSYPVLYRSPTPGPNLGPGYVRAFVCAGMCTRLP